MKLYKFLVATLGFIFRLVYRVRVHNKPEITDGPVIICSNHVSLVDPVTLAASYPRIVHFMAKKELFDIPIFGRIIPYLGVFPVDREGIDITAIKTAMSILRENKVLGIFPEGTRIDKPSLNQMKDGVGALALRTGAYIQPVRIKSSYRPFSRVDIYYRDPIYVGHIDKKDKNADHILTEQVFYSIYDEKVLK